MKRDTLVSILENGILAPSADNLQPWYFRLREDGVDLWIDLPRVDSFAGAGLLMPYVESGAVIENIRVAAAEGGFHTKVNYLPDPAKKDFVASLSFEEGAKGDHPHYAALHHRVTNRKFYRSHKIDEENFNTVLRIATEEDMILKWIPKTDAKYSELSKILGDADQIRYESERLHREFIKVLRFKKESEMTRDGLNIPALEAGPGAEGVFKLISSWDRLKFLNSLGLSKVFNAYTRKQMASSEAALLLALPSQKPLDYVRGGEVLERIWHELTLARISVQPMQALPIFINNFLIGEKDAFTPAQREKVEELKVNFYSLFNVNSNNGLVMLFRLGYAHPVSARTPRRPIEAFIKS